MKAEAIKTERILLAQGEAESIQLVQQAKAIGLDAVRKVYADKEGAENLLMMEVLRSQNEIAKDLANGTSQKIFLPTEAAGLFGPSRGDTRDVRFKRLVCRDSPNITSF